MFEEELDELEMFETGEGDVAGELEFEDELMGDEAVDELAAELLEVQSEEELEEFLGALISGATRLIRSPVGRALVQGAKKVARQALPTVGGALGDAVGGSTGRSIGRRLGQLAASRFELEAEELESARRVIQTVQSAAKVAGRMRGGSPQAVAKRALSKAMTMHRGASVGRRSSRRPASGQGGRWVRRGRSIIVMGM